jgi:hypothetical protein
MLTSKKKSNKPRTMPRLPLPAPTTRSMLFLLSAVIIMCDKKGAHARGTIQKAEEARWLVKAGSWGHLSWLTKRNGDHIQMDVKPVGDHAASGGGTENDGSTTILTGGEDVTSTVTFFGESDGRLFFHLSAMDADVQFQSTLTLSEASVNPSQFEGARCGINSKFDPEDPRCAKLSISGIVSPCANEECRQLAMDSIFPTTPHTGEEGENGASSPTTGDEEEGEQEEGDGDTTTDNNSDEGSEGEQPTYPIKDGVRRDGDVIFHEMHIQHIWLTFNYGGGSTISITDYNRSMPVHHPSSGLFSGSQTYIDTNIIREEESYNNGQAQNRKPPSLLEDNIAHARWIVGKSLWTTLSTNSYQRLASDGIQAWGNVRSTVDGECFLASRGLPQFYVPSYTSSSSNGNANDPTILDLQNDDSISLSFSDAGLSEMVHQDAMTCGVADSDPNCAIVTLYGRWRLLKDDEIEIAKSNFRFHHPYAIWLSEEGDHHRRHTARGGGGDFYTIEIEGINFHNVDGKITSLDVKKYLKWRPYFSSLENEEDHCASSLALKEADQRTHRHNVRIVISATFAFIAATVAAALHWRKWRYTNVGISDHVELNDGQVNGYRDEVLDDVSLEDDDESSQDGERTKPEIV